MEQYVLNKMVIIATTLTITYIAGYLVTFFRIT